MSTDQAVAYLRCVCPAWASLSYRNYGINLEGASSVCAWVMPRNCSGQALEALVPSTVVICADSREESRTTKRGREPLTGHRLNHAEAV